MQAHEIVVGEVQDYARHHARSDGKRRFFAVLHTGAILGPRATVRAAIVAEQKALRS